jgi:hypothetical protein
MDNDFLIIILALVGIAGGIHRFYELKKKGYHDSIVTSRAISALIAGIVFFIVWLYFTFLKK